MNPINPAKLFAGLATAAACVTVASVIANAESSKNTSYAFTSVAQASALGTGNIPPTQTPDILREERLGATSLPSDGSNGCGMMQGVDVCSLDFIQTHAPQYLLP